MRVAVFFNRRDNVRSRRTGHRIAQMLERRNHRLFPAAAQEAQHRLDLRPHVAGRKMPGAMVLFQFSRRNQRQRLLPGLLVIQIHVVGVGGDHEQIDSQLGGQQCRRAVLVDHRLNAPQFAIDRNDRNSATAGRYHQRSLLHQRRITSSSTISIGSGDGTMRR